MNYVRTIFDFFEKETVVFVAEGRNTFPRLLDKFMRYWVKNKTTLEEHNPTAGYKGTTISTKDAFSSINKFLFELKKVFTSPITEMAFSSFIYCG